QEEFRAMGPNGKVAVTRMQIPVVLGWAMNIQKAQGKGLQRVKVDLSKSFDKG
ncbi:hypothetical protein B0H10DRAFT_1757837, partial [Mycena sp. CBHHK59/15]